MNIAWPVQFNCTRTVKGHKTELNSAKIVRKHTKQSGPYRHREII